MNRFDTTGITDPSKQLPLLGPSVAFMQDANKDLLNGLALSIIGDLYNGSDAYSIYGCTTNGGGTYVSGYIYWNSEMFKFAGRSTTGFTNTGVFQIQDNATAPMDPYSYTDGTAVSPHRTRTIDIVDLPNGTSGTFTIAALKYAHNPPAQIVVSSFSNSFATQLTVAYRKNNQGLVTIQGIARKLTTSTVAGQTIFTLPTGYRPITAARNLPGFILYDTATLVPDFINISTGGVVSISGFNTPGSISSAVDVYFTGISFYAD